MAVENDIIVIGTRSITKVIQVVVAAVIFAILAVLFVVLAIAVGVGSLETYDNPAYAIGAFAFIAVLMLGLAAFETVLFVKILRLPKVLITREGDVLHAYCGKKGMVDIPCEKIREAKPFLTIAIAPILYWTGKYDATIEVRADGETYKIPNVRHAKDVSEKIYLIADELRNRNGQI